MNVCILVAYGTDLSVSVDMTDVEPRDAVTMLGTTCNELLRLNLALTMQEET